MFTDGHERSDVKRYRQEVFAPLFCEQLQRSVQFNEDGDTRLPTGTENPVIFITHDESHFNANDAKSFSWGNDELRTIRPKGRGKGIMVSEFLTPVGRLCCESGNQGIEYASRLIETGANKDWWTNDMMMDQLRHAVSIFKRRFPNCTGLWLFDNSTNHGAFAPDALVASRIAMNPGGKQPHMRNGFIGSPGHIQTMTYGADHELFSGQPKGAKAILQERGLWRDGLILTCKNRTDKPQCAEDKNCCARAILSNQPDFKAQASQIEEYLRRENQMVLFYPKFHCECNWIERFWSHCKRYTRENCSYDIAGLRLNVPAAMMQVPTTTIKRYFDKSVRIIRAYADGIEHETSEYQERVYRSHRRLENPN